MEHILKDIEVRVLGALIENEITTPDYYPLSLNALMAACSQSLNRHPVSHFDEGEVGAAADSLREKGFVHLVDRGESRVTKYRHVLYEALTMNRWVGRTSLNGGMLYVFAIHVDVVRISTSQRT